MATGSLDSVDRKRHISIVKTNQEIADRGNESVFALMVVGICYEEITQFGQRTVGSKPLLLEKSSFQHSSLIFPDLRICTYVFPDLGI